MAFQLHRSSVVGSTGDVLSRGGIQQRRRHRRQQGEKAVKHAKAIHRRGVRMASGTTLGGLATRNTAGSGLDLFSACSQPSHQAYTCPQTNDGPHSHQSSPLHAACSTHPPIAIPPLPYKNTLTGFDTLDAPPTPRTSLQTPRRRKILLGVLSNAR